LEGFRGFSESGGTRVAIRSRSTKRLYPTSPFKRIRRGPYGSVTQLKAGIQEFIDAHQANPTPFVWTKSADEILASIARSPSGPPTREPRNQCHESQGQDTRTGCLRLLRRN
jgi:hypothetical protein